MNLNWYFIILFDQKIRNIEAKTSKKSSFSSLTSMLWFEIGRDTPAADVLKSGNKLNDSGTEQVEDVTEKKSAPRQREMWAKDLHTLRSCVSF